MVISTTVDLFPRPISLVYIFWLEVKLLAGKLVCVNNDIGHV